MLPHFAFTNSGDATVLMESNITDKKKKSSDRKAYALQHGSLCVRLLKNVVALCSDGAMIGLGLFFTLSRSFRQVIPDIPSIGDIHFVLGDLHVLAMDLTVLTQPEQCLWYAACQNVFWGWQNSKIGCRPIQ
eukprot:3103718-Amphidinium_carterae.1